MSQEAPYLVDSHCHLDFDGLIEDIEGVISRAHQANVQRMLTINTRLSTFDRLYELTERFPELSCSVGVHPHEAENESDTALEALLERAAKPKHRALHEQAGLLLAELAGLFFYFLIMFLGFFQIRVAGLPIRRFDRPSSDERVHARLKFAIGHFESCP